MNFCSLYGSIHGIHIISIVYHLNMPAISLKTGRAVFGECDGSASRQRDIVVVVKAGEFAQPEVPG